MNSQAANNIAGEASDVVTTKRRPLLFLTAYLIGVIMATGIYTYRRLSIYPFEIDWAYQFDKIYRDFLFILFCLPWGMAAAVEWILSAAGLNIDLISRGEFSFPANSLASLLIGLSYLLTLVIPLAGMATTKQRTFRIFFFAFIGLLILNVGGCSLLL